jgi:hypothetical protein
MTLADIIPPKLRDRFRSIARDRRISVEAVVEEALGEYAQAHDETNSLPAHSSSKQQGNPKEGERVTFPVYGDAAKKLSWEELKQIIQQQEYEDNLRSLGMSNDASDGR